jgi:hypothetical protein
MERAHVRTKQLPPLQRGFERSRLEEQLVVTAYELAVPIYRQPLSPSARSRGDQGRQDQLTLTTGGLSA